MIELRPLCLDTAASHRDPARRDRWNRGSRASTIKRTALVAMTVSGSWTASAAQVPVREDARPELAAAEAALRSLPPPGAAMAVVRKGQTQFWTFGRERMGGAPVSRRTVFQIASLTKPFTAIVILKLAEEGLLSLDDRAAKWLDWLPAYYSEVTLRQLLNHTSGVPRDLRRENVDEFPIEEFRRRFLAAPPSFPTGEKWEYSNTGYTLLALVAEKAGSRPFGELLRRDIFAPLGMRSTRYRAPLRQTAGRASGYDWQDGKWSAAPYIYSGFGNSGIESTSADLALFASALQKRRLLRPSAYQAMLSPAVLRSGVKVDFPFRGARSSYGLGWFLSEVCGAQVAAHGGTIAGFSSNLAWAIVPSVSVVGLSNGKSGPDRIGIVDKPAAAALERGLGCARQASVQ